MISEIPWLAKPGILKDVICPILGLYEENVSAMTKYNEGGVNVLHDIKFLVLNLDLDNVAGDGV